MKKHRIFSWAAGGICAIFFAVGLLAVALPENASLAMAITVMVVSIASGLILPNPFSLVGLIAGILMLFLPLWVVGLVLCLLGASGMIWTPFQWKKKQNI